MSCSTLDRAHAPDTSPSPGVRTPPTGGGTAELAGLLLDTAGPLAAYYALHIVGASDWMALIAATAAAGVRMIITIVVRRRVSWFAAIMLGIFGVGLALAFIGGSPRFILVKDSITTAIIGTVFLASLMGKRPLTLSATRASRPRDADALERLYRDDPVARRAFRVSALGWGIGLLGESLLRIPLVYLLPIDVMVGLSTAMMIIAMIATAGWNAAYITRAARRHPPLGILLPGGRGNPRT